MNSPELNPLFFCGKQLDHPQNCGLPHVVGADKQVYVGIKLQLDAVGTTAVRAAPERAYVGQF
jgi:hypothetical protein